MASDDLRAQVARELEVLSAPDALLHVNAKGATWRRHSFGATGPYAPRYTPARVRLHHDLVELSRGGHLDVATDGLAAVVTAGPPAAGKSTALEKLGYSSDSWRRIDPDEFKKLLIEHDLRDGVLAMPDELAGVTFADKKGVMPMELAGLYHHESTLVADMAREATLAARENVIIEGTLSWDGIASDLISELVAHDYEHLEVLLVEASLDTALAQSIERWWAGRQQGGLGGRFTPAATIQSLYLSDATTRCAVNARDLVEKAQAGHLNAALR